MFREGKYYGFGLDRAGLTPHEMTEFMRSAYNQPPLEDPSIFLSGKKLTKYLESTKQERGIAVHFSTHTMDESTFRAQGGGKLGPAASRLIPERLEQ